MNKCKYKKECIHRTLVGECMSYKECRYKDETQEAKKIVSMPGRYGKIRDGRIIG